MEKSRIFGPNLRGISRSNLMNVFVLFLGLFSLETRASIICPSDRVIYCDDDRLDLVLTGKPTLLGGHANLPYGFVDSGNLNSCGIGSLTRTFYVDENGNSRFDLGEASCTQNLDIQYRPGEIGITYPPDITVSCLQNIPYTAPSWYGGPCDALGISYKDEVFETVSDACKKVVRTFSIINWCTHVPGTNIGFWTGTQIIKVIDEIAPVLAQCPDITFGVGENCKSEIVLKQTATDATICTPEPLSWRLEIDLWADGTIDYVYSEQANPPFRLSPTQSGEEISVTLPELVGEGRHKAKWVVRDACQNATACQFNFYTEDQKPPTPYCIGFTSATLNASHGMTLEIPADFFDQGSFDLCDPKEKLKFSFSPDVNDTIKTINCNNIGFQFFQIHVHDSKGNYDFCPVFMLVFDNGSCNAQTSIGGKVSSPDGSALVAAKVELLRTSDQTAQEVLSNEMGAYSFVTQGLYEDFQIRVVDPKNDRTTLELRDLLTLKNHLLQRTPMPLFQQFLADSDENRRIDGRDFQNIASYILNGTSTSNLGKMAFLPSYFLNGEYRLRDIKTNLEVFHHPESLDFVGGYMGEIYQDEASDRSNPRNHLTGSYFWQKINPNEWSLFIKADRVVLSGMQLRLPPDFKWNSNFDKDLISGNVVNSGLATHLMTKDLALEKTIVLGSCSEVPKLDIEIFGYSQDLRTRIDFVYYARQDSDGGEALYEIMSNLITDQIEVVPANKTAHNSSIQFEIISSQGEKILTTSNSTIPMINQKSGLYLLRVIENSKVVQQMKFIKI